MIRRICFLIGLSLMSGLTAMAQDEPKGEVFLGYSYVRANPGSGSQGINLNGGSGSASYNFTPGLGIVGDFGGYHVGQINGVTVDGNLYTYLFGPKLTMRGERFTPYVQALFGGAHASSSLFGVSENSFAMALGGGLDVKVANHVAIRAIQAEYLMTRFNISNLTTSNQNNARISAGIVFRFGE